MKGFILLLFLHLACREVVGKVLEKDVEVPDIWTELGKLTKVVQGLAAEVVEQKVELRVTKNELQHSQSQVEELMKLNAGDCNESHTGHT